MTRTDKRIGSELFVVWPHGESQDEVAIGPKVLRANSRPFVNTLYQRFPNWAVDHAVAQVFDYKGSVCASLSLPFAEYDLGGRSGLLITLGVIGSRRDLAFGPALLSHFIDELVLLADAELCDEPSIAQSHGSLIHTSHVSLEKISAFLASSIRERLPARQAELQPELSSHTSDLGRAFEQAQLNSLDRLNITTTIKYFFRTRRFPSVSPRRIVFGPNTCDIIICKEFFLQMSLALCKSRFGPHRTLSWPPATGQESLVMQRIKPNQSGIIAIS